MHFGKTLYGTPHHTYKHGQTRFQPYYSDGTGRDFYVKLTDGGNTSPYNWRNSTEYRFRSSLRSHDSMTPKVI